MTYWIYQHLGNLSPASAVRGRDLRQGQGVARRRRARASRLREARLRGSRGNPVELPPRPLRHPRDRHGLARRPRARGGTAVDLRRRGARLGLGAGRGRLRPPADRDLRPVPALARPPPSRGVERGRVRRRLGRRRRPELAEKLRRAEDFDHWASFGRSFRRLSAPAARGRVVEAARAAGIDRRPLRRRPPRLPGGGRLPARQRSPKPRLPGRLLAVPESARRARAPRDPASVSTREPAIVDARAGARRRRARPRDRLALPGGPLLRQPGGEPDARRALGADQAREDEARRGRGARRSRPRSSADSPSP